MAGASQVFRFCTDNDIHVLDLLKAAWAAVLRGYTGNSNVCFGVRVSLENTATVACFDIDVNHTLLEAARNVHRLRDQPQYHCQSRRMGRHHSANDRCAVQQRTACFCGRRRPAGNSTDGNC